MYILYHPPTSGTTSCFLDEQETLFTDIALSIVPSIIVGDFNIHYEVPSKADKLVNMLEMYDLIQHVNEPTHTHTNGHILDLVISASLNLNIFGRISPTSANNFCKGQKYAQHCK